MAGTVIRAIELPLQALEGCPWAILRRAWKEATTLANWCVRRLFLHDGLPDSVGKHGKKTALNLYKEAAQAFGLNVLGSFWAGASGSFADIAHRVQGDYNRHRLAVLRGSEAPLCYRYPYPFPVRGQEWKEARHDSRGRPQVVVNLPSGKPGKPLHAVLTMRGGPEFGRQLALFRQIASGAQRRVQLVIREQPAARGCHRPTLAEKAPDGGNSRPQRVMVKMVVEVPVRAQPGQRTLVLLTDPAALWVAELDGRQAWVLNADHVRRGLEAHRRHLVQLQRLSEDAKAERRLDLRGHLDRLATICTKDRRRLDSWTHETAAHLVGFAGRQHIGEILYLDRDRGFAPRFPWHELHGKLADKCAVANIDFYSETQLRLSGGVSLPDEGTTVDSMSTTTEEDDQWQRIARLREMAAIQLARAAAREGSHPAVSAP